MATRDCEAYSINAGSAVTEGQFLKQSAGLMIPCSVLGERADAVAANTAATGEAVDCYPRAGKKVPIKVGAVAVLIDAELTTDALGLAKTAVSTNVVRARALKAGAAGATIECHWVDAYIKP